ncbi:unnamed protein product [Vicia faba]|uniref:Uncharacterized protein n=1 Tax=Vicia faba TaxID=3906 RepID=A0AAV1A580_VICFA|nr:unnamed protein product [Vicia faba]
MKELTGKIIQIKNSNTALRYYEICTISTSIKTSQHPHQGSAQGTQPPPAQPTVTMKYNNNNNNDGDDSVEEEVVDEEEVVVEEEEQEQVNSNGSVKGAEGTERL